MNLHICAADLRGGGHASARSCDGFGGNRRRFCLFRRADPAPARISPWPCWLIVDGTLLGVVRDSWERLATLATSVANSPKRAPSSCSSGANPRIRRAGHHTDGTIRPAWSSRRCPFHRSAMSSSSSRTSSSTFSKESGDWTGRPVSPARLANMESVRRLRIAAGNRHRSPSGEGSRGESPNAMTCSCVADAMRRRNRRALSTASRPLAAAGAPRSASARPPPGSN